MFGIRLTPDRPHHALPPTGPWPPAGQLTTGRGVGRLPIGSVARLFGFAILAGLTLASGPASGSESGPVSWHRSLEQATTAAAQRNRQVLVLFTAAWSPASTQLRKHVLTDPDAVALLNACFEPVLIDVDDDPETTNSLGIRHVPGGCILAADGSVISRFECPSSTGLFIATVARRLQQVPANDSDSPAAEAIAGTVTVVAERAELANDFSTAGSLLADAAATGPTTESGAVGQIAAKVRGLSHFATADTPPQQQLAAAGPAQPPMPSPPVTATAVPSPALPTRQPPPTAAVLPPPAVVAGSMYATAAASPAMPQPPQLNEQPIAETASIGAQPRPPATAVAAPAAPPPIEKSQPTAGQPAPSSAPWAAEPGQFSQASPRQPVQRPWQPAATATPASSTLAAATPAVTGGLIEPERSGTSPAAGGSAAPWLQSAPQPSPQAAEASRPVPATVAAPPATSTEQLAAAPAQASGAAVTAVAPPQQEQSRTEPSPKQPNPVLAAITNPFGLFKQDQPPTPQQQPNPQPEQSPRVATARYAQKPVSANQAIEQPPMPLGLEGYCPVTLVESGNWVEGQAGWGARHRGRTYLFRGLEEQQAFLADPDRYAPALSGDDPVAAFDSGTSLPGERRYGVTYQQRIYLFASPESRAAFAANPQRYTSRVQLAEQPTTVGDGGTVLR